MQVALAILLACAAVDLAASGLLLGAVWVEYRRVRRDAAAAGEDVPSAAGQFGCLITVWLVGLGVAVVALWLVMGE